MCGHRKPPRLSPIQPQLYRILGFLASCFCPFTKGCYLAIIGLMKRKDQKKLVDYSKIKFRVRKSMRYDDVGDYFDSSVVAFDMKNPVFNNAILLHEFIEYSLIRSAGIPVKMIDAFDTDTSTQKKHKKEYKLYCKYHRMANNIERHFIENMGMDWKNYQKAVYSAEVKVKSTKKGRKKQQAKWKVR